jgi:hypothetical protein
LAVSTDRSSAVSRYSTHSAAANDALETNMPAAKLRPPSANETARTSIGNSGKNAALPSDVR